MTFDEFLGLVQNRAQLASTGEALRATRATLTVLGQRLYGGEAKDLAAQLPQEIKLYLQQAEPQESFDLAEFYRRVSEIEGLDLPVSVYHARAVISVLRDAVNTNEIQDALDQLPDEFDELFMPQQSAEMRRAA